MTMMMKYGFNKDIIQISESPNEVDIEFDIQISDDKYWAEMKEVQKFFEENDVYTDVLFYAFENHHIKVIVRREYYTDFLLGLMKHQLLERVEWA